jgi:hypothetical protein
MSRCRAIDAHACIQAAATPQPTSPHAKNAINSNSIESPSSDPGQRIPDPESIQLVNRLILTLRMRPKAASVAIIDDPP